MKPIRVTKPRKAAVWRTVAILGLAAAAAVVAQEPDATGQTNELTDAEVLSRLGELIQAAASGEAGDMAPPSGESDPNTSPHSENKPSSGDRDGRFSRSDNSSRSEASNRFQSSSRSQGDDRRSRSRRSSRSSSSLSSSLSSSRMNGGFGIGERYNADPMAGTNTGPASLDYSAFKIIVERNIFDPNRYPARPAGAPTRQPTRVDSLTLVGTMSYDKGTFAFFDGTSSDYKKALKQADLIAGYKVTNILPSSVTLASGTNELKLVVGMQLRREEEGPWRLSGQSQSYAPPATSTATNSAISSPDTASAAPQSEIIKRLMQRRQEE
ncbi:MAG TPA: hypothetical protein P5205_06200 [Candidatus Paceibacterota bacterium]|nr:hypothetical protein [Verrucomicrobiota bacterium]HSA09946.1 hypothetical protein [Candidatus Paceibacterota bacterium]